ncbi:MAG: hypothetical protein A3J69_01295 [Candidatus Levybacteria bacterium RIFCSPHIGHO2_02_FULL_42_12]|nr:MAG: hypothetical protein A2698_02225 [Candidatus Levybacteria bacterium RIFCSPHIGHO2_01_FULL_42_15]OGH33894.1 MAG: hypothetical protein A3J69_01295 [Candidatus Levybacteria bacterium RIFCSPHIGHO2_02_FULL_42_12]OGH42929.1 MAG: hypothetical protein A3B53_02025 [Candidatus Levybacteria bacterium RIFCSPLOWO2_01_FULL_42_15]
MNKCVFCAIRDREIPSNIIYEDEDVLVFPDIHPFKPVHLLIVPKKHIGDFLDLSNDDLFEKLKSVAQKMVREKGLKDTGYRVVVNGGGAQAINHLHVHLFGPMGRKASL